MKQFHRCFCLIMWLLFQAVRLGSGITSAEDVDTSHRLKLPLAQQEELRRSDDLNSQLLALYRKGDYAAAMKLAEEGLEIRERILGPEHIETGTFVNNLAAMYSEAGDYAAAEKLYLRAVRIDERYAGPDHPKTALRISNLALVYMNQAKFGDARALLERALAINEKALGPEHSDTAAVLHNLAGVFNEEQKYAQAVPLFERALQIREKVLGPDDENTGLHGRLRNNSTTRQRVSRSIQLSINKPLHRSLEDRDNAGNCYEFEPREKCYVPETLAEMLSQTRWS